MDNNKNKMKILKFIDAGRNNWDERAGINNMKWIDREEWRRKIKL